ncbi:MAG: hypothetical protein EXQ52_05880 [Bryobacterales bacterium]|nr:hypothetical protein [Bryobacterales bacterium]
MTFGKLVLLITAIGVAGQHVSGETFAITGTTVIDPGSGRVRAGSTVVVEDGRIKSIQPAATALPGNARRIRGEGKYLIPGLWDSHVHLTKLGIGSLPLFIANGVTSVRDMGSDLGEVAEWRRRILAGTLIGPRIKTSGQILESRANVDRMKRERGVEPFERIRIGIASAEEGRAAVANLISRGADHIKMRTTPDASVLEAVALECTRLKIPFTAHPLAQLADLIRMRQRSVEHFGAFSPIGGLTDSERRLLFAGMAKANVFMSTTLANLDGSIFVPYAEAKRRLDDAHGRVDPRRKYVCGYLVEDWREQVEEKKDAPYAELEKMLPGLFRDLRGMREASVPFLAGTDAAVALMYPGFTLHDELENLVNKVGFQPMEALRVATYNPALFYGEHSQYGAIAVGQSADLVLLDADPLVNVGNTRKIRGVMLQGRWFDGNAIRKLLKGAERHAAGDCWSKQQ